MFLKNPVPSEVTPDGRPCGSGGGSPTCSSAVEPASVHRPETLSVALLDNLAARVRAGGMFLTLLGPDGTPVYHDPAAGLFFQRFVSPLLQYPQALPTGAASAEATPSPALNSRVREMSSGCGVVTWDFVPGVALAAFPYVERRQVAGVFVLAAKGEDFCNKDNADQSPAMDSPSEASSESAVPPPTLTEDVARLCSRLGLDGGWLAQEARQSPAYGPAALQSQARLVLASVRDQVRLGGLEQELDSLSGQLANTYEELSLIYQISSGMKVTRGAGEFFKQACLDVLEVMTIGGMGVALCAERRGGRCAGQEDDEAAPVPGWRQEPVLYGQMSLPPGQVHRLAEDLISILRRRKAPLLVNDLSADKTLAWAAPHVRQLLAVPLQRQDQVLGCLFALDKGHGEFDSVDSKLLNSIANESAIYLENARLYEDVRDLMMGLLHALTSAVDAKDAYTCGHSERVALLSQRLARQAHLPTHLVERIYMAGLLHDVGKIGVPEAVLQKTGRLTADEFDHMKKHPQIGAHILADIKQVEDIIPGVLHHHERYDGKGYPANLVGAGIPLMGRIICLADCFDAMTSNRTYRRALPLEVALTEIRRCAGTQFDPVLTEAFLQISPDELRALLRDHQQGTKQRLKL